MLFVAIVISLSAAAAWAEVKVAGIFGSQMVLQREQPIRIWGQAAPGEQVTVSFSRTDGTKAGEQASTVADAKGQWELTLGKYPTGGSWALKVSASNTIEFDDILIGDVWLCSGQSNMQWVVKQAQQADQEYAKADLPAVRMFTVPRVVSIEPGTDVKADWIKAGPDTAAGMSAVGYFFGRALHEHLDVPIGLVNSSWGGTRIETWMTPKALAATPNGQADIDNWRKQVSDIDAKATEAQDAKQLAEYEARLKQWEADKAAGKAVGRPPKKPRTGPPLNNPQGANHLYFSMIQPIERLKIRGVIWYQGEANAKPGQAQEYRDELMQLVLGWREVFAQPELPFFWVQLPEFGQRQDWPLVREAMLQARSVPHTEMAIALGLGDEKNIHPGRKREVGERLALLARHVAYGEQLLCQGPIYKSAQFDAGKAIIEFDHIGEGLVLTPQDRPGFEIAGEDKKFVPAQAKLENSKLVVWSDSVPAPKAVRYGWSAYPAVWLTNSASLPASPFRTDDWPM